MAKLDFSGLTATGGYSSKDTPPEQLPKVAPGPAPGSKPKEHTMLVVMHIPCRAWYNMDYEPHLDDEHYDMRTGEPCIADDSDWFIMEVPYREDWYNVR